MHIKSNKLAYALLIGISFSGCKEKDKSIHNKIVEYTIKYKPSNKFDPAVFNLLPISGDTLIAVKWHGGLSITTNAGLSWRTIHEDPKQKNFVYFKHLMFDKNRILWGLDSWKGIHEADYSRLSYSTDLGEHWTMKNDFNTADFFPYTFRSKVHDPLRIATFDGNIYESRGRFADTWSLVMHQPDLDNTRNDTIYNDYYFDDNHFKLTEENYTLGRLYQRQGTQWRLILESDFITEADAICRCNNSIYLTATNRYYSDSAYYLFRIYKNKIIEKIKTPQFSSSREDIYLECDNNSRLWLYNFRGIWLKQGKTLVKRY